ncbi:hypothetical protein QWM81_28370 [Streptomyces ficellus]|uniref:Secreted protein n=1 Tax=Streptomyces ficellus TaxID=1977088 RepID=A0ABT7ZEF3_9ACTN|nr:hypothetical protein [Streptomyces ficellus]MDN3297885.1 hypothetical protein [Streptomyces ficellus]
MASRVRRLLVAGIAAAATAVVGASTLAVANAAPRAAGVTAGAQAADDGTLPPVAVEDFSYPGAAKILQEKGIKLFKGDGHILLADCDGSASQIQVWTRRSEDGKICFQANAHSGYLTLEVPEVFALQTADRAISADLTAEGKTETVAVPKDKLVPVGEGTSGAPTVLVEIRVTG